MTDVRVASEFDTFLGMDTTDTVPVITETATSGSVTEESVGKQVEENGLGQRENGKVTQENEEAFGGPRFFPPLYRQRYSAVAQILKERQVKSVSLWNLFFFLYGTSVAAKVMVEEYVRYRGVRTCVTDLAKEVVFQLLRLSAMFRRT